MSEHIKAKSDFMFADTVVPVTNVVLVVHSPDEAHLDVWMPRHIADVFTPAMRDSLVEAITDFIRHVPVRKN